MLRDGEAHATDPSVAVESYVRDPALPQSTGHVHPVDEGLLGDEAPGSSGSPSVHASRVRALGCKA